MSCHHLTHSYKFKNVKENRRLINYNDAGNCHKMNHCNRSLNKNTYLRFLRARLLREESLHFFLLGGPKLIFTAAVMFDLGLLIGCLAL